MPVHSTASSLSKRNRPSPNTEKRKPMLNWTVLVIALAGRFFSWLGCRSAFSAGSDAARLRSSAAEWPGWIAGAGESAHQEAVRRLEQATAEIHATPETAAGHHPAGDGAGLCRTIAAGGRHGPPALRSRCRRRAGRMVLAPTQPARRLLYLHGGSFIAVVRAAIAITTKLAQVTGPSPRAGLPTDAEHSRRDINADCQTGYRWILDHGTHRPGPVRDQPGPDTAVVWR